MSMRVLEDEWYVSVESFNGGSTLAIAIGHESTIEEMQAAAEAAYRDWTKRMAESCGWTVTDIP